MSVRPIVSMSGERIKIIEEANKEYSKLLEYTQEVEPNQMKRENILFKASQMNLE